MNSALAVTNGGGLAAPEFNRRDAVAIAIERRNALVEFTQQVMKKSQDYGEIPGTNKPTLLKPGAEKLCTLYQLSPRYELVDAEKDWTGKDHGGEPFFYFQYRCLLTRNGVVEGEGIGSCNSWEKKYRYRDQKRSCPKCGAPAINNSKDKPGYYCWRKIGGCGATFQAGDQSIEGQATGQVPNPDIFDIVNTLDKMAQKRALVAAALIACNASEFFTQDMEDLTVIDAGFTVVTEEPPRPAPTPAPKKEAPDEGNREHVAKLCELLGVDAKEIYPKAARFAVGGKNCPLLTPEELGKVTAEILAIWGSEQGVFNNLIHARSAFWKVFPEASFDHTLIGFLVENWSREIARRQAEQEGDEIPEGSLGEFSYGDTLN